MAYVTADTRRGGTFRRLAVVLAVLTLAGSCTTSHSCATHRQEVPELAVRYDPAFGVGPFLQSWVQVFADGHAQHTSSFGKAYAANCRNFGPREISSLRAILSRHKAAETLLRLGALPEAAVYDAAYLSFRIDGREYWLTPDRVDWSLMALMRELDRFFELYFGREYRSPFRDVYRYCCSE